MFKGKLKRFIVILAERIARAAVRRRCYWIVTTKYVQPGSAVKYVRWFETSASTAFPYSRFVHKFRTKFGAIPTIVSIVEISESDYNRGVKRIDKTENE